MDFSKQIKAKKDTLAYIEHRLNCACDDYNQEVAQPSLYGNLPALKQSCENWAHQKVIVKAELDLYVKKTSQNEMRFGLE